MSPHVSTCDNNYIENPYLLLERRENVLLLCGAYFDHGGKFALTLVDAIVGIVKTITVCSIYCCWLLGGLGNWVVVVTMSTR